MPKIKGKLLIIGGAEHISGSEAPDMETKNIKFKRYEILKKLLITSQHSVSIITSASGLQEAVRKSYEKAFKKIGYPKPNFIAIGNKRESKNKNFLSLIEKSGAVFFTGGDQTRLTTRLSGTDFIKIIKQRYLTDADFLVAGTSAGAMALFDIMIVGGDPGEALISHDLKLSQGLGIANNCIIDTHFIKRGRIPRLTHAILLHPDHLGIGLGEDTALIIKNGTEAECHGSGMVVTIDGKHITKTNVSRAKKGEPIFAENLKINLLVKDNRFSLSTRKIIK